MISNMKKILLLVASLAFASTVWAVTVYRRAIEMQANTRTAPQIDAPTSTEYLNLDGVKKIRATLCSCTSSSLTTSTFPDPGPTTASHNPWLTGGNVDCYYGSPVTGTFIENKDLKLTVPVADGGCVVWADFESPGANFPGMKMFCATNGVTQVYSDAGNYFKMILEGVSGE